MDTQSTSDKNSFTAGAKEPQTQNFAGKEKKYSHSGAKRNGNRHRYKTKSPALQKPTEQAVQTVFQPDWDPEEIYLVICEDMTLEGDGVAKILLEGEDTPRVIFCPSFLPGEKANVKITTRKKNFWRGEVIEIITPSPQRQTAFCQDNFHCGGCIFQELEYKAQLALKSQRVKDSLTRIGGQSEIELSNLTLPIKEAQRQVAYRNHMQYPVRVLNLPYGTANRFVKPQTEKQKSASEKINTTWNIGLYSPQSHHLVPIAHCHIAHPAIEICRKATLTYLESGIEGVNQASKARRIAEKLASLSVRVGENTGEVMIIWSLLKSDRRGDTEWIESYRSFLNQELASLDQTAETETLTAPILYRIKSIIVEIVELDKKQKMVTKDLHVVGGEAYIWETIGERRYKISPKSFFQVNTPQAATLYDVVKTKSQELLALQKEKGKDFHSLVDLYCGSGGFGIYLADLFHQVVGVENNTYSIKDARFNAQKNGLLNIEFIESQVEDIKQDQLPESIDLCIIDPPRKGMDNQLIATLLVLEPEYLMYVSCDPATLARDVGILTGQKDLILKADQGKKDFASEREEAKEAEDMHPSKGNYVVTLVQSVDMFPWAGHVETVVLLSRKSGTPKLKVSMKPESESNYTPE